MRSQKINNLGYSEITQGHTLLSLGKGDRESHSWHPICQKILLALPLKYIQNPISYHHLLCYPPWIMHYGLLSNYFICFLTHLLVPLYHSSQPILNTVARVNQLTQVRSCLFSEGNPRWLQSHSQSGLLALFLLAWPFQMIAWLVPFIPSVLYSNVTTNVILVLAILSKMYLSSYVPAVLFSPLHCFLVFGFFGLLYYIVFFFF